jgi:hypothetical protein
LPAGQNRESSPAVKAGHGAISPNGFEMTGVRLLRGRLPTEADERLDARVAVVSRTLAERLFGDRNPLGQPILVGDSTADAIEIVGVVSDPTQVATVEQPLRGRAGHPFLYRPLSAAFLSSQTGAALLIEGTSDAAKLGPAVDRVVRGRRSEVLTRATVAEMVRRGLAQYEIVTVVVLILGGLCVALGLIGLYGTIAYAVERRTQEIGVRIAIGASSGQVVRLVLRGGLVRSGVAILLGLPLAYGFHRGLVAIVFDLPSLNAATLAATASLVVLASSLACLLPARRAARVDPIEALRCE